MSHITLPNPNLPGISGLLDYNKTTAQPLLNLAEVLLRSESTLTSGERELIAAHVSYLNNCHFCHTSHAAAAVAHLVVILVSWTTSRKTLLKRPFLQN
jgi:AhpD family alkylhydroperoxidase